MKISGGRAGGVGAFSAMGFVFGEPRKGTRGDDCASLLESGFTGFSGFCPLVFDRQALILICLVGIFLYGETASWEKRNPENPANLENPDSDKGARAPCSVAIFLIRRRAVVVPNQTGAYQRALAGFIGGAGVFHPAFSLIFVVESD